MLAMGLAASSCLTACRAPDASRPPDLPASPPIYDYRVVNAYPHDPSAYTQGLVYRDDFLFESTGLNGRSTLRKVRLESGEVIQRCALAERYFAEGLTDWDDRLVQLTWRSGIGFIYDLRTLKLKGRFGYIAEGWGLTHDAKHVIMSDGTSTLRLLDPATLRQIGRLSVKDDNKPVRDLNELEFVRGEIFANVWQTERIARIDPRSGKVVGWIDLSGLTPESARTNPEAVLNGIAYDEARNRLFVTGKLWPKLFEISLKRRR